MSYIDEKYDLLDFVARKMEQKGWVTKL